jgi:membrane fusion protein, heavy metal efflux system
MVTAACRHGEQLIRAMPRNAFTRAQIAFSFIKSRILALSVVLGMVIALPLMTQAVMAHAGHDHGADIYAGDNPVAPRITMRSTDFDLVAVAERSRLLIYLDSYADNAPVRGAKISLTHGGRIHSAKPIQDGIYSIDGLSLMGAGNHDLVFEIRAGAVQDLLAGSLVSSSMAMAAQSSESQAAPRGPRLTALAVPSFASISPAIASWGFNRVPASTTFAILLASLGILLMLGRRMIYVIGLFLVAASASLMAHDAFAQTPSSQTAQLRAPPLASLPISTDTPRRLADGSVFIPKATQRLLDVRTSVAQVTSARGTVSLPGRIIADPSRSAVVQSLTGGRIAPVAGALPLLGQPVSQGDPLVTIIPLVGAADAANLTARDTETNLEIRRKAEQMQWMRARLSEGRASNAELMRLQVELMGLWQQRDRIRQALRGETLTAPIDGVIAAMNLRAGQIVQPQDVLFQIVDPRELWIEASAFGLDTSGAPITASASLEDGRHLALTFRGRSQALRDQANVLHFRLNNPPAGLSTGMALTVHADVGVEQAAIVIPRSAVVRNASGDYLVYDHIDPERFVPRPVRVEGLDGERALVRAGLSAGAKVVVRAAEFVNQVR